MSFKLSSYPRPDTKDLQIEESQHLRPLVPLREPPRAIVPTSTSLPQTKHDALPGYTRSSHIVPAAFPRTLPTTSPLRETAISGQKVQAKILAKSFIDAKLAFENPSQVENRGKSDIIMWNCVDRYVRAPNNTKDHGVGITLFLTHANGYPRQIWEPTLVHLVSLMAANPGSGVRIDEIWSFEAVQHGDSALINAGKHCDIFDWQDHVRDIVNFLAYYLPEVPGTDILPTILHRVPQRKGSRPVVGLGHSFGGTTLALAAITHSKLFESLILVEPLIVPTSYRRGPILNRLLHGTLRKPSKWPSSQAAKGTFLKYPPMNTWDPAVIDVILEHGLAHSAEDSGPPTVRMKIHPVDEVVVYCDWLVPYEVWTELEKLDPRIPLHWIMSGETNEITGGLATTQMTVWRRPANSTNTRLPGVGHLIVQESSKNLGEELYRYLKQENFAAKL